jgi:FixJ family two-component response regulator
MGFAQRSWFDISCLVAGPIGLQTKPFASVPEFLKWKLPDGPRCLVLDVRLPGLSGLDFQSELNKVNVRIPIVFMTGHGDIPMSVRAMKGGAVDFLSNFVIRTCWTPFKQVWSTTETGGRAQALLYN